MTAATKPAAKKTPTSRARKTAVQPSPTVATAAAAPTPKAHAKKDSSDKPTKAKRVELVRDGFTMPEADFALIATLKTRSLAAGREAKKSELLRAGLQALAQLDAAALAQALNRLESVKTGRPKKGN